MRAKGAEVELQSWEVGYWQRVSVGVVTELVLLGNHSNQAAASHAAAIADVMVGEMRKRCANGDPDAEAFRQRMSEINEQGKGSNRDIQ